MSAQRVPADSENHDAVAAVAPPRRRGGPEPSLTRLGLLPLGVLAAAFARFAFAAPFAVAVLVSAPFVALFAIAPWLSRRALTRFDRDSVLLLATGRGKELWALYRRSRALRFFAPPAEIAARRGFVCSETGDPEGALTAYRDALDGSGGTASLGVQLGYAHACFACEDDVGAIAGYRDVLATGSALPRVSLSLARSLLRFGEPADEAILVLTDVDADAGNAADQRQARLTFALAHARAGDHSEAARWLERAGKLFEDDEKTLRREVLAAKGTNTSGGSKARKKKRSSR